VGSVVSLENVLLVKDASGTTLGTPYVEGAKVDLEVMAHRRGTKILVYKMRPKKKTRRKNGHRQELTRVMVKAITVGGTAIA
jgi:large subunit ribosomal protein L21